MKYSHLVITVSLLLVCNLMGCFSARAIDIEAFLKPHQVDTTAENYIMQPPDEIEVHCEKNSTYLGFLHLQRQKIRPDGKVSFEGLGEIDAAGKTPKQVSDIIEEKARQLRYELKGLEGEELIEVRVVAFSSKFFHVLGEVSNPGPKLYTGRDTVLTALSFANPEVTAWTDQIQVIRPSHDKKVKPRVFRVIYKDMIEHGDLSKNVLLQEGDIIYVPPTILASVAMVVEEFVRPIGRALSPVLTVSRISTAGSFTGR